MNGYYQQNAFHLLSYVEFFRPTKWARPRGSPPRALTWSVIKGCIEKQGYVCIEILILNFLYSYINESFYVYIHMFFKLKFFCLYTLYKANFLNHLIKTIKYNKKYPEVLVI